jgi:BirA family biotin operon repressor/biotin-[acetyl-CoA-carboxylase] ligase
LPLDGLSLAVGVMVAEALADAVPSRLSLKWPNDLLLDGTHKLGGILIETVPGHNRTRTAVIGLGINMRTPTGADLGPDALPAAGLDGCIDGQIGRDDLLDRLLANFAAGLPIFAVQGFAPFRERWWRLRAFAAGEVVARLPDGSCNTGRVVELTDGGALVIESGDGLHTLVSGEVSLRAVGA